MSAGERGANNKEMPEGEVPEESVTQMIRRKCYKVKDNIPYAKEKTQDEE